MSDGSRAAMVLIGLAFAFYGAAWLEPGEPKVADVICALGLIVLLLAGVWPKSNV